jgi:hypothetical protein
MEYKGIEIKNIPSLKRGGNHGKEEHLHGLIDFCIDNVEKTDTILELGCFYGASTSIFSHFSNKVISVDLDFSKLPGNFLETHKNIELIKESSLNVSDLGIHYDLLYIDTVHTFHHCTQELTSLYDYCRSSPRKIGGHDYHMDGIKLAVHDFFGCKPTKTYDDQSWYYEIDV